MPDTTPPVNFYELLGIDPLRPLSADEARQLAKDAVARWNKQSGQPGREQDARLKRSHMSQWMGQFGVTDMNKCDDQALQAKLDSDRQALLAKRRQTNEAKRTLLEAEVAFAALKGIILQREVDAWTAAYGDVATQDEIEQLARPHRGVERSDESQLSKERLDRIDATLGQTGEQSLFSLLQVQESASDKAALDAAERLYSYALRQHIAEGTLKKELSGEAKAIFANPLQSLQYRIHVRQQQFYRTYLEPVKTSCDVSHEITSSQADHLLTHAEKDGWNREEATETLFRAAWERGWRVLPPTITGSRSSDQEFRKQLDIYKQEMRRHAKQHQEDQQRITDAEKREKEAEQRATVAESDRDRLKRQHRNDKQRYEQEQAASTAERKRLENELQEAQQHGAETAAELRRQLSALKLRDETAKQRHIADAAPLLALHMAQKEYVAARGIIKEFSTLPPQWADDSRRIERDIAEAQRLLAEAQRAERASQLVEAESLVEQALARCADLPQAQKFRASLRPEAPERLEVSIEQGAATLRWKPSPSRGVRYAIVRSEGRAPLSVSDGIRLAYVDTCAWRDESPPLARSLWYAVFAERGSAISEHAAMSADAVLLIPDVQDVQAESQDAAIALAWRLPRGANFAGSTIWVVRNDTHAPHTADDGQTFTLGETTRFLDADVINGHRYYYRIYCEYTGPDGNIIRSAGVAANAIPIPAPAAMPELTLRGIDGITNRTVYLDAPAPASGTLVIYRTGTAPALSAGSQIPVEQHKSLLGADCLTVSGQRDTLLQAGEYFYTPVVLLQQTAYVGASQVYRYCPPVRQFKASDIPGQGVELRWTLPLGCDSAEVRCVAMAPGAAPPIIALAPRAAASDVVYVARGLARGVYKIDVLARYQFAGQVVYSKETSCQVAHIAPIRVRYTLQTQRERGFMGRAHPVLVLSADEPVALPSFQVVYGQDPIASIADGRLLGAFAGSPHPSMTWAVPLAEFTPEPGARIHVLLDQPTQATEVIFG